MSIYTLDGALLVNSVPRVEGTRLASKSLKSLERPMSLETLFLPLPGNMALQKIKSSNGERPLLKAP